VPGNLPLLMTLRVQGIASPERVATALGRPCDEDLGAAVAEGLAVERSGRVPGFVLTAEGSDALDKLLAAEGLRGNEELTEAYERFLALNRRVLELSSDWQLRRERGVEAPNDHSDADYDASVIGRLGELHDRSRVCLDKIAGPAPRFAPYRSRLDACVDRLLRGDRKAFTAPMAESYHTVWFELHQDLLLTLGLERES
jgi:hypothetical protein